jgi:hypothetical protein
MEDAVSELKEIQTSTKVIKERIKKASLLKSLQTARENMA